MVSDATDDGARFKLALTVGFANRGCSHRPVRPDDLREEPARLRECVGGSGPLRVSDALEPLALEQTLTLDATDRPPSLHLDTDLADAQALCDDAMPLKFNAGTPGVEDLLLHLLLLRTLDCVSDGVDTRPVMLRFRLRRDITGESKGWSNVRNGHGHQVQY